MGRSYSYPVRELKGNQRARNSMKASSILAIILALISLSLPACNMDKEQSHEEHHKIVVTSPQAKYVTVTQPYVCQIHSQRHINVRALQDGYLEEILVKEGQTVKEGEVMFRILPTLYKAEYDAEVAEVRLAQIKLDNTKKLYEQRVVSIQDVRLHEAELAKAQAKMELAKTKYNFTFVRARFDGIVDQLQEQVGSLIKERDILTTLSDNSLMWVYFNVPEARYFEFKALASKAYQYKAVQGKTKDNSHLLELVDSRIELRLADGQMFNYSASNIVTVEGQFDNKTGNIPFRADFPNPDRLLRHGQTGTVLIYRRLHNAIVIPQRAVSEFLDKQFVYVVGEDGEVHQRPIVIQHELDDIFVIEKGLDVNDKFVLEGSQYVSDGAKVEEYEFRKPEEALANQKNRAE
ncbi:MAG TPA: efflux RND transporter periplasmic adaptor subunit [Gemmataceae bacterium]|jgi:membrane fusion protein (multidrug efflux system)